MARNESNILFGKGSIVLPGSIRTRKIELSPEQWLQQVTTMPEKLDRFTLKYTIALRARAYKIFNNSFSYNRFYSAGSMPWAAITDSTWKSRQRHAKMNPAIKGYRYVKGKRGESSKLTNIPRNIKLDRNKILREFGYLKMSLTEREESKVSPFIESVFINRSEVLKNPIHKEANGEWALWHNTPGRNQTYGVSGVRFKQRQFMGHSSYLIGPGGFIEKYEKRYLFDSVFDDGRTK